MRIVSLVPNGTEVLFALGAGELVVGVSHECDYPPEARSRPILTGSALASGLSAAEVDAAVSAQLALGKSLYSLDEERIASLAPEIIVTQQLCPVCAVSTAQVDQAVAVLPRCPELLSLDPRTLEDVLADILRVGERLGLAARAGELVASLRRRLEVAQELPLVPSRPRVVALEWLDPPFLAGHWVPEMIHWAGGEDAFARPGEASRRTQWQEIAAADPDFLLVAPCGFDVAGAARELAKVAHLPLWQGLRAAREGHVAVVDANGHWSRPGPRLVDGVEELARRLAASFGLSASPAG
ncbi:MAG: cobalamin-binding protein [Thermoanaerobaculia bacterium]